MIGGKSDVKSGNEPGNTLPEMSNKKSVHRIGLGVHVQSMADNRRIYSRYPLNGSREITIIMSHLNISSNGENNTVKIPHILSPFPQVVKYH